MLIERKMELPEEREVHAALQPRAPTYIFLYTDPKKAAAASRGTQQVP